MSNFLCIEYHLAGTKLTLAKVPSRNGTNDSYETKLFPNRTSRVMRAVSIEYTW